MCSVVNLYKDAYDIYIGRGSPLGNPYRIDANHDREAVIALYKSYLWQQIQQGHITVAYLQSLYGKRLGCYCKPKPCHGDVIVKAVDWARGMGDRYGPAPLPPQLQRCHGLKSK